MGSGSSVAVSGWENVSPARQQELIVLHTDLMTKNNRQETEVVTLLTIVEWQRIHCSAIRPASTIKYAGLFVDNGINSIEALGMKIGNDKDWLEGTLGMDMFDSEELVDALNKHQLVKMSAVVASSSASASAAGGKNSIKSIPFYLPLLTSPLLPSPPLLQPVVLLEVKTVSNLSPFVSLY